MPQMIVIGAAVVGASGAARRAAHSPGQTRMRSRTASAHAADGWAAGIHASGCCACRTCCAFFGYQCAAGWRGTPCVGPMPRVPGYYLAVTHSGVTMAPFLGKAVADEIAHGRVSDALADFRPARFFN